MRPAFRTTGSALRFSALLTIVLLLPEVTLWIGHPPREQAYAALSTEAGPISMHVGELTQPGDADILILGSSLAYAGLDVSLVEQTLGHHLGRPARVRMLALNWQGLDLQYFLLRDFLRMHQVGMILWNTPVPGARNLEPHVQAFRWVRFGEYTDAFSALPLRYQLALYGDMIDGAPRELLMHLRPGLLGSHEFDPIQELGQSGYYGSAFVPEGFSEAALPKLNQTFQQMPYPLVRRSGKPLNEYERHFAALIIALATASHTLLVPLHLPVDSERGDGFMPERETFTGTLHIGGPFIGASSEALFRGMTADEMHRFYRDQHFNANGRALYTTAILPAIIKAYDSRGDYDAHSF